MGLDREEFVVFVQSTEPRLRRAFVAAFGVQRGDDAVAEALAWAWEHFDRVAAMQNPAAVSGHDRSE